MDIVVSLVAVICSSLIIARACDGFEVAADYLGRNMSDGLKGATINAIGSSIPELFVTIVYLFVYHDTTGFAGGIGTTAGSAVFNSLVIPAGVILVVLLKQPEILVHVSRLTILRDGLTLIVAELVLIYTLGDTLNYHHGLLLMLIYIAYASWSIFRNSGKEEYIEPNQGLASTSHSGKARLVALLKLDLETAILRADEITTAEAFRLLSVSTGIIAVACWLLTYGCEKFGHVLGLNGYFVAVILAAAASSVPDAILSLKDARKGNYDDALSNALGSNIFDICFALGAPLFAYTLMYGPIQMPVETSLHVIELRVFLVLLTVGTFLIFLIPKHFTKTHAYILISGYLSFVAFIGIRAYNLPGSETLTAILHWFYRILMPGI